MTEPDVISGPPRCWCAAHPERPCMSEPTQEDLLCDACRPGACWVIFANNVPAGAHVSASAIQANLQVLGFPLGVLP